MSYRMLADLVLALHLGFIVFAVTGGLLALRWRWAPLLHLPAAAWAVFIELSGGICPLTPLEIELRRAAGAEGYSGGFIEHYLVPILYPAELSRSIQFVLTGLVVLLNALVYSGVLWWHRRRAGKQSV
ncbi:MAG: DUF2784 domain-containing protein [Nevskiales bacterium]|nr:DUF2784 domain-containing protein [Nevskiales bacterium]